MTPPFTTGPLNTGAGLGPGRAGPGGSDPGAGGPVGACRPLGQGSVWASVLHWGGARPGPAGCGHVRRCLFSGDAAGGSPDGDSEPVCTGQGTGGNGAASLTSLTVPVHTNTALPKDTDPAAPARVRSRARPGPAPHHRHRRARGAGAPPGGGGRRTVGTGVAGGGLISPSSARAPDGRPRLPSEGRGEWLRSLG